jgi:5'-deoxynucleotidase YfbR-like HD superfamily hydrolase
MKAVEKVWLEIIDVWRSGQVQLPKVQRWKKYDKPKDGSKVRKQNSLQHSYSITVLGRIFCLKLDRFVKLNVSMMLTAWLLHDHGEGEIQKDTLYIDKTDQGDLDEYLAFRKRFSQLGSDEYDQLEKAFLLQFAAKSFQNFPEHAQHQMRYLLRNCSNEVYAFEAVERWDYLLYAIEQYQKFGNEKILVQVLRHQIHHLDRLTSSLPGFGEIIWTEEVRVTLSKFLHLHKEKWIEKKDEK